MGMGIRAEEGTGLLPTAGVARYVGRKHRPRYVNGARLP
jgi:hypothetical protein